MFCVDDIHPVRRTVAESTCRVMPASSRRYAGCSGPTGRTSAGSRPEDDTVAVDGVGRAGRRGAKAVVRLRHGASIAAYRSFDRFF